MPTPIARSLLFPFIDLLHDGYSKFRYAPTSYLSANFVAVAGVAAYGTKLIISTPNPPGDAYAFRPSEKAVTERTSSSKTFPVPNGTAAVDVSSTPCRIAGAGPYPLSLYVPCSFARAHYSTDVQNLITPNIGLLFPYPLNQPTPHPRNLTNQPTFATSLLYDHQIRFFNSVTTGTNPPISIKGSATLKSVDVLGAPMGFAGVSGIKADTAFVKNDFLACKSREGVMVGLN